MPRYAYGVRAARAWGTPFTAPGARCHAPMVRTAHAGRRYSPYARGTEALGSTCQHTGRGHDLGHLVEACRATVRGTRCTTHRRLVRVQATRTAVPLRQTCASVHNVHSHAGDVYCTGAGTICGGRARVNTRRSRRSCARATPRVRVSIVSIVSIVSGE